MLVKAILLPVFASIALTFVLLVWTGRSRVHAVKSGQVKLRDIALGQQSWPGRVTQVGNSFNNQFQLPVLFYAAVIVAIITKQADWVMVVLAWLFVATRLVHSTIHTTGNNVLHRFNAYVAGFVVLAAIWIYLAFNVLTAGGI